MTTNNTVHYHKVDSGYFDRLGYWSKHQNKSTEDLKEDSAAGMTESVIHHRHLLPVSPLPSPDILHFEEYAGIKHRRTSSGKEQHVQSTIVHRSRREKTFRNASGFIVPSPGLARVSSDPVDRLSGRRRSRVEPNLRVNTLTLRSHSSSYFQQQTNSPKLSTQALVSAQSSLREYQAPPLSSPSLHSPIHQRPSFPSQLSSHYSSSTVPSEANVISSSHDRKKLAASSASLTSQIPATVADPVVIDWTSPSTRRREYREIDKCNRGFRRAWKAITPRCCWCKSWRRGFYVASKDPDGVGPDNKDDDDGESVRRYRLDLEEDDEDEKVDEGSAGRDNDFDEDERDIGHVSDNDDDDDDDDNNGGGGIENTTTPGKNGSILGLVRARLCRSASRGDGDIDSRNVAREGQSEKGKLDVEKGEVKEKRRRNKNKKRAFGDGLICFQLHEIP